MKVFRGVMCVLLLCVSYQLLSAETWYVRPDGGTRYSSKAPAGQCNGKADKPYSGTGINQPCAFKDVRYLWTDGSVTTVADRSAFPAWGWIGKGGDTYLIHGGPWRVGQAGPNPRDFFGLYGNPYDAGAPPPPSGSVSQHTRILGEHFNACNASNKTELFGGFGVYAVLNLRSAFVDVDCLDLSRHSTCIRVGNPPEPRPCRTNFPLDDYAANGIAVGLETHDLLLQNVAVHGFTSNGIVGGIGGKVTLKHVTIGYNGSAGWDLDDGHSMAKVHPFLDMDDVTVEWSGCNQKYPGKGAYSCYSQSSSGYGDGIGAPTGQCIGARVDHSTFRYNTQDGFDFLHNDTGTCPLTITNSYSYGNNGAQFKWGVGNTPVNFSHNVVIANCLRLSAAVVGSVPSFNNHLSDYCRAEDNIAFYQHQNSSVTMTNNTIITYEPTLIDVNCADKSCPDAALTFKDNVVLGYDNPKTYNLGGKEGGAGGFYSEHPVGKVIRSGNLYWGLRDFTCPTGFPNEQCADPKFINQPKLKQEQDLDNFNVHRSPGAPMPQAGAFPL